MPSNDSTSTRTEGRPDRAVWLGLLAAVGPLTLVEPRLSVFGLLLLVIGLAALTRYRGRGRRVLFASLGVSLLLALVGMTRFVLREALPGILEASGRATETRAVSRLREILFAQDAVRRLGLIDPDGNGVGGAGRLGELTGTSPVRPSGAQDDQPSRATLSPPLLGPHFRPRIATPSGEAAEEGDYLYLVCVPDRAGGLTAHPSSPVDEKAAERRFVAYAWPARVGPAQGHAFFLDEHERILETDNRLETDDRLRNGHREPTGTWRLLGPERAPSCQDALTGASAAKWRPWRGKRPRANLPGL